MTQLLLLWSASTTQSRGLGVLGPARW